MGDGQDGDTTADAPHGRLAPPPPPHSQCSTFVRAHTHTHSRGWEWRHGHIATTRQHDHTTTCSTYGSTHGCTHGNTHLNHQVGIGVTGRAGLVHDQHLALLQQGLCMGRGGGKVVVGMDMTRGGGAVEGRRLVWSLRHSDGLWCPAHHGWRALHVPAPGIEVDADV